MKVLDLEGLAVQVNKVRSNFAALRQESTLTARLLSGFQKRAMTLYETEEDRIAAQDVVSSTAVASGEICYVVASGKWYQATADGTGAVSWEEFDAGIATTTAVEARLSDVFDELSAAVSALEGRVSALEGR